MQYCGMCIELQHSDSYPNNIYIYNHSDYSFRIYYVHIFIIVYLWALLYGICNNHWYCALYGYIKEEIIFPVVISYAIYIECLVKPTSAVGDVSATSNTLTGILAIVGL